MSKKIKQNQLLNIDKFLREGKIDHVEVETRHASTANETLNDLKNGKKKWGGCDPPLLGEGGGDPSLLGPKN